MEGLEARAGRVLMVGFRGAGLDDDEIGRLRRLGPGGAILFRRNLETPRRLVELMLALGEVLPAPALLALDQEGGRVSRLEPWIGATPTATRLAEAGPEAARRFGRATGAALSALGFNVDFAPVVDLCAPEAANGIGDRSFGTDPARVATLAGAFLDGLQGSGVAGCLKHFPGLGDTAADTHQLLPVCERDRERLLAEDLAPYAALRDRAASVMVGHAGYAALQADPSRPASLSPEIVRTLLRDEIGYEGLVVSDDLEMGAVAPLDRDGSAAVEAVAAGCDQVLYCSDLGRAERARDALVRAARGDAGFARRLAEAARRVEGTAARWRPPAPDLLRWDQARGELLLASGAA